MRLTGTMQIGEEGHLWIGGCDTTRLAEQYGTPLFVYDERYLRDIIRGIHGAFRRQGVKYQVSYASKAFCTLAMCQLAFQEDCSLDVVSGGELHTALRAGVPPKFIHLHGNNKTHAELQYAVESGVGTIIVDNFVELRMLQDIASAEDTVVDILLRIAPGVEAHTHEFVTTGQQDSKFGFDRASGQAKLAMESLADFHNLHCSGLHSHIGSQIFDTEGFLTAVEHMADLYSDGLALGLPFTVFNIGGGFGIRYTDEDEPVPLDVQIEQIVQGVIRAFAKRGIETPEIWTEPGRSIAGPAGTTLYRVGTQKTIPGVRNYVAIDGGMTDNPRLALYGAKYEAVLANRMLDESDTNWSVAGKCCESGDMIIWDAALPNPKPGDLLAVFSTGAYNFAMASHYNRIPHPAVVFVRDGKSTVVVERETWDDVLSHDRLLSYAADSNHSDDTPPEMVRQSARVQGATPVKA